MRHTAIAFAIVALSACQPGAGTSPAASPAEAPKAPSPTGASATGQKATSFGAEFEKLYARETTTLTKQAVAFEKLKGETEASAAPAPAKSGGHVIEIPIGSEVPISCAFSTKPIQSGAEIRSIFKGAEKQLNYESLKTTEVTVAGEYPVVFVEARYREKASEGQKQIRAGLFKTMAFEHPSNPMICWHDEIGYAATFKRATMKLAETLKDAGAAPRAPKLHEIFIERSNDKPTGFTRVEMLPPDKGVIGFQTISAKFVVHGPNDLVTEDDVRVEATDPRDMHILQIKYVHLENTDTALHVTLRNPGGNRYTFTGTRKGTKLEGEFKTKSKRGIMTQVSIARELAKMVAKGKPAELKFDEYRPEIDAENSVEVVYKLVSKDDAKVEMTLGGKTTTFTLDKQGRPQKTEGTNGNDKAQVERVVAHGTV